MTRPGVHPTLLQRFTLLSALVAVGLAIVLSAVTVRAIERFAVKDEAQVAAEHVLRSIAPLLQPGDFEGSFPAERRMLLDSLFRARGISDRILRVRLWAAAGRLLYSNVREPSGLRSTRADLTTPSGYADFVRQRRGVEEAAPGVARFFVPVQVDGQAAAIGAFEIFYDLTLLRQQMASVRRTIWTAVPLGHLVLYGSVFLLVRRASRRIEKQQADLLAAHLGTYHALASAIDTRDYYTGDHSTRVAVRAVAVGRELGLSGQDLEDLQVAGRLHDLGKIGVPDAILTKRGPLSHDEQEVMRRHAEAGYTIMRDAPLPDRVKAGVRHAHERWDGTGYPDGLSGEAIPLFARILAVVDAYEAMTVSRPYREGMPPAEALERLRVDGGVQFDPRVVEAFARIVRSTPA